MNPCSQVIATYTWLRINCPLLLFRWDLFDHTNFSTKYRTPWVPQFHFRSPKDQHRNTHGPLCCLFEWISLSSFWGLDIFLLLWVVFHWSILNWLLIMSLFVPVNFSDNFYHSVCQNMAQVVLVTEYSLNSHEHRLPLWLYTAWTPANLAHMT